MDYLILSGDRMLKEVLQVYEAKDTTKTTIGDTWKDVCLLNYFQIGDTIHFKFDPEDNNQRCHVFKLSK
jgi:hypothetical protein